MKQIFKNKVLSILGIIFVFTFLNIQNAVAAEGSFGWFASKVEYVDNLTSCGANEASIEIWLVENGTKSLLSDSIGVWKVTVRNNDANFTSVASYSYNGQKKSDRICFDPVNQGLQVTVQDSGSYFKFLGPSIFPSVTGINLSSMVGNHFKGYVELVSKASSAVPNVESVSPSGQMFSDTTYFEVKTNSLNSIYDATQVKSTRIYAVNQTTNQNYTFLAPTAGGIGTRYISSPPNLLPEGVYFWTFHQELNGKSVTNKLIPPATQWTFSGIPASGAPNVMSFTVDKSAPNTVINSFLVSSLNPAPSSLVSLKFRNEMSDTLTGLATTTIFVTNSDGSIIVNSSSIVYSGFVPIRTENITIDNLTRGETYRFYAITEDRAGNIKTSDIQTFTIPLIMDVPTLIDLEHASTTVLGQYYIKAKISNLNNSGILKYGTCWSTVHSSPADLILNNSGVTCTGVSWQTPQMFNPLPHLINHLNHNLPSDQTIFYRAYAVNLSGTGYTEVKQFNTPISPLVDPTLNPPTVPTVVFADPYWVKKSDRFDPGLQITSLGGMPTLTNFGICLTHSELAAQSVDPYNPGSAICKISSPLSSGSWSAPRSSPVLPHTATHIFDSLLYNTKYYFKVFAENDIGMSYAIGSSTTADISFYFRHINDVSISPKAFIDDVNYNPVTNKYDYIDVQIAATDDSSEFLSGTNRRTINFTATIDYDNNSSPDETNIDTIIARVPNIDPLGAFYKTFRFYNVPLGTHKVNVRMNHPETIYPQTNETNRDRATIFTLTNPNVSIDSIAGSDDGTGSGLVIDPELKITAKPNVIRPSQSTTIHWEMQNVNSELSCKIIGPDNFDGNGEYTFSHSYDSGLGSTRSGNINSGSLQNTQIFKFECIDINDSSISYSTTTRVTVLGTVQEI